MLDPHLPGSEACCFALPHVELAGCLYGPEDGQPVIVLHGWLDNAMSFARLVPQLHGLRLLVLDLAGHGLSGHYPPGASYLLWDHARDVLMVAEQLGWQRFALIGHSLGGVVAGALAAACPARVDWLALIDGLFPLTAEPSQVASRLGHALESALGQAGRRRPVYASIERAALAREKGGYPISSEAVQLLLRRGLREVAEGYVWRCDSRLTRATPVRLDPAQSRELVKAIRCPGLLLLASTGILPGHPLLSALDPGCFQLAQLEGGHHLHLDDDAGASAVASCINRFVAGT